MGIDLLAISACVITLNEEYNIEACLAGLGFADEIVVVDSMSTDRTVEIARTFTEKIVLREFNGFSEQKSAALEMATGDWVFFVDADEIVSEELALAIADAVASGRYDAYRMPRRTSFLGREMRYCGWYPDYQLRLARREKASFPERLVHETIEVDGSVGTLKSALIHSSYPSMEDYMRKMTLYARAAALQKHREGRAFKTRDILFNPGLTFLKMYVAKQGYRDGLHGLILSLLTACSSALRYAMLWEIGRGEGTTGSKT
jgi:glycosyltransferase involved in cell wall biosynthesis